MATSRRIALSVGVQLTTIGWGVGVPMHWRLHRVKRRHDDGAVVECQTAAVLE
jgi:hypothetical protein